MAELREIVRFSQIPTNGIHLHVAETGPPDGPLVFLLHGFPEFWYGWRNQIVPLAENGWHVLAPDQRGYNLSDKPQGIGSYDLDRLAADIVGLAAHFHREAFDVVGHDWGASVGWWLAGRQASPVRRLVVLNAPHPAVWLDAMRNDPVQKRKSAYVRFLRLPYLPEFLLSIDHSKALAKGFRDSIRPDAFTEADLSEYRKAWGQPGALQATIITIVRYCRSRSCRLLISDRLSDASDLGQARRLRHPRTRRGEQSTLCGRPGGVPGSIESLGSAR